MKTITSLSFIASLLLGAYTAPVLAQESTKGHYYRGTDIESFIPCGSDNSFWVVGDEKILKPLRDKMAALSSSDQQPYGPLYVELTGRFEENQNTEGVAADYDGLYRIISVLKTDVTSPPDCLVIEADD